MAEQIQQVAGTTQEETRQTLYSLLTMTQVLQDILVKVDPSALASALDAAFPQGLAKEHSAYAIESAIGTPETGQTLVSKLNDQKSLIGSENDSSVTQTTLHAKANKMIGNDASILSVLGQKSDSADIYGSVSAKVRSVYQHMDDLNTQIAATLSTLSSNVLAAKDAAVSAKGRTQKVAQERSDFAIQDAIGSDGTKTVHSKLTDLGTKIGTSSHGTIAADLGDLSTMVGAKLDSASKNGSLHAKSTFIADKIDTVKDDVSTVSESVSVVYSEIGQHVSGDASLDTVHKKLTEILAREGNYTDASCTTIHSKLDTINTFVESLSSAISYTVDFGKYADEVNDKNIESYPIIIRSLSCTNINKLYITIGGSEETEISLPYTSNSITIPSNSDIKYRIVRSDNGYALMGIKGNLVK